MEQNIGVWLICEDGRQKGKVLLQLRSQTGKALGQLQSHAFICQGTINGKVGPGENLMQAIKRGAREELGEKFAVNYDFNQLVEFHSGKYSYGNKKKGKNHDFVGRISKAEMELIKLYQGAFPDFIFVFPSDFERGKIKCLSDKFTDPGDIILFNHQWSAFKCLCRLKKVLSFSA